MCAYSTAVFHSSHASVAAEDMKQLLTGGNRCFGPKIDTILGRGGSEEVRERRLLSN
jgi:hypothetical protein